MKAAYEGGRVRTNEDLEDLSGPFAAEPVRQCGGPRDASEGCDVVASALDDVALV